MLPNYWFYIILNQEKETNMKKKIVLLAGGTGGHVFPAIAISEELTKKKIDHVFLTDTRCENIIKDHKIDYKVIQSSKFSKKLINFPLIFIKTFHGFLQSLYFFIYYKPKCIIGFGGYICLPSLLAAKLLRIPIFIHEQNAVMGKANRFYSKFATKIILGFKKTKYCSDNAIFLGTPVRKDFKMKIKSYNNDKIRILVLGGSQGAKVFSTILPKIISHFSKKDLKNIFLIQQSRKDDILTLTKFYKELNVKFILKSFFNNISEEMNKADIIISRSGASTLSEISVCSKPAILFPLPSAKDNHQYENSIAFAQHNRCLIFEEDKISIEKITTAIREFIVKPLNTNRKKTIENSAEKIIKLLNYEIT